MFNSRLRHPAALALVGMAGWFGLVSGASAAQLHRSGKAVVEEVCIKCHGPGTDGAPRIGNRADWTPRAKDGLPRLLRSSMDGYRKMPAHGGQPGLTDLEMTRAIAYMVSGGKTPEPTKTFDDVKHGTGEQIVAVACGNCHREGANGAPKIGDGAAWRPRLEKGINELVLSAANGHNKMPSRGGFTNLSDLDIRAAVSYMASKTSSGK
jgi:cytochrome c5